MRLASRSARRLVAGVAGVVAPWLLTGLGCGGREQVPVRLSSDGECDLDKPFALGLEVPGLGTKRFNDSNEDRAVLTADELYIVFHRRFYPPDVGQLRTPSGLYGARRRTQGEPFGEVERLFAELGGHPSLSSDGLALFSYAFVEGSSAIPAELRLARRASREEPWVLLPDRFPEITPGYAVVSGDGTTVYFAKYGEAILRRRWEAPRWVDEEVALPIDAYPVATNIDGKILVFQIPRSKSVTEQGIWLAERQANGAFGAPKRHPEFGLESAQNEWPGIAVPSWVSPNGCRIYYSHDPYGGLWIAQRGK